MAVSSSPNECCATTASISRPNNVWLRLSLHAHQVPATQRHDVQTLSILISNISNTTSMFFLFSNNHLNDIIALGYELRDEEVLAHFITLLKAISFKINIDTIQFFFQADSASRCAASSLLYPGYSSSVRHRLGAPSPVFFTHCSIQAEASHAMHDSR
jgi:hypothetical protein